MDIHSNRALTYFKALKNLSCFRFNSYTANTGNKKKQVEGTIKGGILLVADLLERGSTVSLSEQMNNQMS